MRKSTRRDVREANESEGMMVCFAIRLELGCRVSESERFESGSQKGWMEGRVGMICG
jgi:hypothetical protein